MADPPVHKAADAAPLLAGPARTRRISTLRDPGERMASDSALARTPKTGIHPDCLNDKMRNA